LVGPYIAIVVVVPAQSAKASFAVSPLEAPLRALVIDSQPLFLAALSTLLGAQPLSARVTTCARTDAGLGIARASKVDVVFCEVRAGPMPASEFISALADELPGVPVILLGDRNDEALLIEALTSGAAGSFTKDAGLGEFLVGVQAVIAGHRAIGASLIDRVLDGLKHLPATESRRLGTPLSPTEVEILVRIGRAESIPAIAASRGISPKTVRNHLARIYRKLDLHGRTEAMLWAARTGLTSRYATDDLLRASHQPIDHPTLMIDAPRNQEEPQVALEVAETLRPGEARSWINGPQLETGQRPERIHR
jgi:DNA-binding NarL/FixJ family response regulator